MFSKKLKKAAAAVEESKPLSAPPPTQPQGGGISSYFKKPEETDDETVAPVPVVVATTPASRKRKDREIDKEDEQGGSKAAKVDAPAAEEIKVKKEKEDAEMPPAAVPDESKPAVTDKKRATNNKKQQKASSAAPVAGECKSAKSAVALEKALPQVYRPAMNSLWAIVSQMKAKPPAPRTPEEKKESMGWELMPNAIIELHDQFVTAKDTAEMNKGFRQLYTKRYRESMPSLNAQQVKEAAGMAADCTMNYMLMLYSIVDPECFQVLVKMLTHIESLS